MMIIVKKHVLELSQYIDKYYRNYEKFLKIFKNILKEIKF